MTRQGRRNGKMEGFEKGPTFSGGRGKISQNRRFCALKRHKPARWCIERS